METSACPAAPRVADGGVRGLALMLAVLRAVNRAILQAGSRAEMCQLVCEAVTSSAQLVATRIVLAEPDVEEAVVVAAAGDAAELRPLERCDCITALHTGGPCLSHGFDETGQPISRAVIPLPEGDRPVGALLFTASGCNPFVPEWLELLQRLAEIVSFALDRFERADGRRADEEQRESLTRMFAALSATNEAIIRAHTRAELFQLVCNAAVRGGKFASTIVALAEPDSDFMRVVAWAGPKGELQKTVKIAVSDAYPEGRGVSGTAYRTLQVSIINDYYADERGAAFRERALQEGNRAAAALPLLSGGKAVGVLVFLSSEADAFTPELVELLERLANNVSFALDNFTRAQEKAKADERIKYLATHDVLTNLPNRTSFNLALAHSIETAQRDAKKLAILFIDLDRFKVINDSLGHDAGDALLIEIGRRLRQSLRVGDLVARLGGDEFVVILEDASTNKAIEAAAAQILSVVNEPLRLRGLECRTTASIGIALFPEDGEDERTLTKNADMAMYRAKEEGKNGYRFFSSQNKPQAVEHFALESRLRQALDHNELSLHYQPKVSVATREISGVEALLRWTLPDLGERPPMQFIPLAEETGLIVPIGRWILKTACLQNAAWMRQGMPPTSMAVNLSPRQFSDGNLLQDIDDALAASGMPPELLQLEITESMVMNNVGRAIELLHVIRGRGVRLAIDDFGTGYSSMSLIKKFPVDTIKIDRSFVQDLPHDTEDRAITEAIIGMAKALGLKIIAEGVETTAQAAFLRDRGCDEMQGFLFSHPVAPEVLPSLLRRYDHLLAASVEGDSSR